MVSDRPRFPKRRVLLASFGVVVASTTLGAIAGSGTPGFLDFLAAPALPGFYVAAQLALLPIPFDWPHRWLVATTLNVLVVFAVLSAGWLGAIRGRESLRRRARGAGA